MPFFPCAHAGNVQWQHATKQVVVQLKAQITMQHLDLAPTLGLVYVSQAYASHASAIFSMLAQELPGVQHWVGCAAAAVLGGDLDYGESGALAVLLPCIEPSQYQIFSGDDALEFGALQGHMALVHGHDGPNTTASTNTALAALQAAIHGGRVVGGVSALSHGQAQVVRGPQHHVPASIGGVGVQRGGISGVVFGGGVQTLTISMQGCKPLGNSLTATLVDDHCLLALDGQPALDVLLDRLELRSAIAAPSPDAAHIWDRVQQALLVLSPQAMLTDGRCIQPQSLARPIVGLDLLRRGIVLGTPLQQGYTVTLCQRDEQATRAEIRRACAEISDALVPEAVGSADVTDAAQPHGFCISGAIYVRSQHRNAMPNAVQLDAELQLIRHALGPIPLMGFTCASEIEDGALQHLSAQLIAFIQPLQPL